MKTPYWKENNCVTEVFCYDVTYVKQCIEGGNSGIICPLSHPAKNETIYVEASTLKSDMIHALDV